MAATLERRGQPDIDDDEQLLLGHEALPDRKHVGLVVRPGQPRGLQVPGHRTAHAAKAVRRHRLAVARAAEDHATIELAPCHRGGQGTHEVGVIDAILGGRSEVVHLVAKLAQMFGDPRLVAETGMVRSDADTHPYPRIIRSVSASAGWKLSMRSSCSVMS